MRWSLALALAVIEAQSIPSSNRITVVLAALGVILITLLQSIRSVMQMPEFGRHVACGVVIIAMLLIYGRGRRYSE